LVVGIVVVVFEIARQFQEELRIFLGTKHFCRKCLAETLFADVFHAYFAPSYR